MRDKQAENQCSVRNIGPVFPAFGVFSGSDWFQAVGGMIVRVAGEIVRGETGDKWRDRLPDLFMEGVDSRPGDVGVAVVVG